MRAHSCPILRCPLILHLCSLSKLVERYCSYRWGRCLPQGFQTLDRLGCKEHIATNITHLGRDMLDYDDAVALAHSTHDLALFVFTWAVCNTTSHLELLSVGLIHLGRVGTYKEKHHLPLHHNHRL